MYKNHCGLIPVLLLWFHSGGHCNTMTDCKVFRNHIQGMEKAAYFILFIYIFWKRHRLQKVWDLALCLSCLAVKCHMSCRDKHWLCSSCCSSCHWGLGCTILWEGHCPSHFLSVIGAGNLTVVACDTSVKGLCSLGYDEKTFERDWFGPWWLLPVEFWIVVLVVSFLYMYIQYIKQLYLSFPQENIKQTITGI